jgi:hypothetical protein
MYLQAARYVLKSYLGHLTKGNSLTPSVAYLARLSILADTHFAGSSPWTLTELRDVTERALGHLIGLAGDRIGQRRPGESEKDVINYAMGIRLQQLAQLHGVHLVLEQFLAAIDRESCPRVKELGADLYRLFAIGQLQRLAEPIIEGSFVCPRKWAQLGNDREEALRRVRPHTAVLLDSFAIPDKYLRSEVVRGDPYLNFLNRARECEINSGVSSSALEVGRIREVLAAKPRL